MVVAQHINLLAQSGRIADAGKLLDRIPESSRQALLGPLYSDILFRTNQVDEALKQAKAAAEADPDNPQHHSWYSQLLARSVQGADTPPDRRNQVMAQAIKSMERAVELRPDFPAAWLELINYYVFLKDVVSAQKTLRDAQLALSTDGLPLFLAKAYEALATIETGPSDRRSARWFDAETMYRSVYEMAPTELPRAQQLAAFYLGNVYQRPDRMAKATPLINQILKAGNEGKVPANDAQLVWARRMGAKLLSLTGDYQNVVKAEKLLSSNAQDNTLMMEDKMVMADILASRPEPESRKRAIAILEEMSKTQQLNEAGDLMLGDLYSKTGSDWTKYQSHMLNMFRKFPNSAAARQAYAEKLILRGDTASIDDATKYVTELQKLAPNSVATFQLTARLAGKIGKQKAVRDELVRRVQPLLKLEEIDDSQAQLMSIFGGLLIDLGDLDTAEQIYTVVAAKHPTRVYDLAKFLGTHRSVEKCFEKLNEIYSAERIEEILNIAAIVVRDQRDKVGDKFDAEIERWLEVGLRENPDSINLLIIKSDVRDLQQRYDEAADIYRKLLTRDDLEGMRRAIVLNNLAFLASLQGSAASDMDALKLVEEASQILGPSSDILDTRAVVYISRKQYKEAIRDLELAVTDNPTASKYFHKAQAHLLAEENRAAVEAWEKAEGLGLTEKSLNRMEHELYEQLKSKIDQLRGGSVTQAEPLRRAG
jgi:tetratricopeptide (TPR) repeat protein